MFDFVNRIANFCIDYSEFDHINDTLNHLFPRMTDEEFSKMSIFFEPRDFYETKFLYNMIIETYYDIPVSYKIINVDYDDKVLTIISDHHSNLDELNRIQNSIKKLKEDGWKIEYEDMLLRGINYWKEATEVLNPIRKKYGFNEY